MQYKHAFHIHYLMMYKKKKINIFFFFLDRVISNIYNQSSANKKWTERNTFIIYCTNTKLCIWKLNFKTCISFCTALQNSVGEAANISWVGLDCKINFLEMYSTMCKQKHSLKHSLYCSSTIVFTDSWI